MEKSVWICCRHWNTGHFGLPTGHGNSAGDMLSRLETMALMAADIPLAAVRGQIASAIDILVHLGRLRDRSRRVLEITEVLGYEDGAIQLHPLYRFEERGMWMRAEQRKQGSKGPEQDKSGRRKGQPEEAVCGSLYPGWFSPAQGETQGSRLHHIRRESSQASAWESGRPDPFYDRYRLSAKELLLVLGKSVAVSGLVFLCVLPEYGSVLR